MTVKELIEVLSQYPEDVKILRDNSLIIPTGLCKYSIVDDNDIIYDKEDNQIIIGY